MKKTTADMERSISVILFAVMFGCCFCGILDWKMTTIEMVSFEKCPKEGNGDIKIEGMQSRKNRTYVVENVNYSTKYPFDDRYRVKLTFDLWGNGGWRLNGYIFNVDNCETIVKTLGETLQEINAHTTPPGMGKCPFPPGFYQSRDVDIMVYNKINLPTVAIPGTWRKTVEIFRKSDNQLVGCFRRRIKVTPVYGSKADGKHNI